MPRLRLRPLAIGRPFTAVLALTAIAFALTGCAKHEGVIAPTIKDPVVFDDDFGAAVDYKAFAGSKFDAVQKDTSVKYDGTTSLKITVPAPTDPSGSYAGGTFATTHKRDLTVYNAITFWAKADHPIVLKEIGLGIDASWQTTYQASVGGLAVGTTWAKYVVPIPLAARLRDEGGLFYLSQGDTAVTLWMDDIQYENLLTITNPRPQIPTATLHPDVGSTVDIPGTQVTFAVGGKDERVTCKPGYFTFFSSADTVATGGEGVVQVVGVGTANITAKLGTVDATGVLTLETNPAPTNAPPRPTLPAADVISLLTMVYPNVPVDTWSTTWDGASVSDVTIGGDQMKKYQVGTYAAAEFTTHTIDATAMTAFHIDAWIPGGNIFKVKLVDFGADGVFGGGDDKEQELYFFVGTPPMLARQWVSLDLPLSSFTNLTTRGHLAQLILSGDYGTVYVDNVYFHK